MRRCLSGKTAGYFTVEAALLLPFVMMSIVFMIFLSFFCYDRCILEQCAYAAALRGSSSRFENTQEAYEEAAGAAESLIEKKLFAIRKVSTTVRVSAVAVTVSYKCEVNMPGDCWLRGIVGEDVLCMEVSKKVLRNKTIAVLRQR
ncbi:MAG: pilus assembly protein [Lachnospiraceae bacterium]|nr:pilus assembly protein [Lachnospiraceae bacterium]